MKRAALFMAILLILALFGVGFLYVDCSVSVSAVYASAAEAATQPDLFTSLARQLEQDAVIGTRFTESNYLSNAEDYQFLTYTVRLRNSCYLSADQVEVQITPMEGDILQIGDTTPRLLSGHATGDIQATILTGIGMHSAREITVTYYMWGFPFSLKCVYTP